jgi:hypothetical protein
VSVDVKDFFPTFVTTGSTDDCDTSLVSVATSPACLLG